MKFAGYTLVWLVSFLFLPFARAENLLFIFSDVDPLHPNYSAIEYLQTHGVIQGYPDGTFRPEQSINRAEALKIILRAKGIEIPVSPPNVSFSDYSASDWFAPYIEEAHERGIVQGYPDGTFRPANTVNLVETLKILLETNQTLGLYPLPLSEPPFSDVPVDSWYAAYAQFAHDKNLIDSDSKNNIFPDQPMSRSTFSELIYRFMVVQEYALDAFDTDIVTDSNSIELEDDINQLVDLIENSSETDIVNYDSLFIELGF
ncbi:S-layer homology domain-containing protein [Candidatus Peregrinibacteria bacterium]|nr:S-layer homology domain-containing protein [Candidatus Peregrinibacteria bacterium]